MGYGVAVVAITVSSALRLWLRAVVPQILPDSPFLFLFLGVTIAGWVGGFGPGAFATFLSVILADYFFVEPVHKFAITSGVEVFRVCNFVFQGLLTSALFEGLKRTLERSDDAVIAIQQSMAERDAAEQRFRVMADTAPVLIWMSDTDMKYTYFNKGWLNFTGRTLEQETGDGWCAGVHPSDRQRCVSAYENGFARHETILIEYRLRRADGQYRWVTDHGVPRFTADGQFQGYIGACVDIHDRREIEQRLAAIFDNAADGIVTIDASGRIESFNPAAERLFGYSKAEALGKNVKMLMPDPYSAEHDNYLGNYMAGGRARIIGIGREVEGKRKDGSTFPMDLSVGEAQRDGRRTFTGLVHDVTERKQAEEHLRNAKVAAEAANREKDQFLATVSHELRTPLTAILGWAELLSSGAADPDELGQGIETISRNARLQSRLIEDLLDISRIISGKLRLDVRPVQILSVVDAAMDSMKHAAEAKKITFHRQVDNAGLTVNADAARLQQVVWNLLSNAIKFTPPGGAVDVRLERFDSSAMITVADNGPGIDPDFLPQMFHRFHQADSSSTRKHGGLGLGLSIARHLVELHGGTIEASNAKAGTGAVLIVRVPVAGRVLGDAPVVMSANGDGTAASAAPSRSSVLQGIHVLVVDDEPDALELISRVLQRNQAEVTAVTNAADALDAIRKSRPDVLLSDIAMPGEDGYALIRKVRQMESPEQHIPAAALTAFARGEDRRRALLAGFQMHVAKPVEPAELAALVADLAKRHRT